MNEERRATVLIIDDEPFNIAVLEQELDDLGYATVSAANGVAGLAMVAESPPDLVLLDIMMPGLDGFAVLERLKSDPATRDIPVIIISASSDLASVARGIRRGAADYLAKPFDPVLLEARIGACLEQKRLRDQDLAYLRQVALLTEAAAAVQRDAFAPEQLAEVARRPDALGTLARVFQQMAEEVHTREQRMRRQLEQLRLDLEEREIAAAESPAAYIAMDRLQALASGRGLPAEATGAALFADVSGFTPLTEALADELGHQRGAEELTRYLNRVFGALIAALDRHGGSAVMFGGDAITCWFDDTHPGPTATLRAIACALAMQAAMAPFAVARTPSGTTVSFTIKTAVASGPVRRWAVGDPAIQLIDVLAGPLVDQLARGESLADGGEVVVAEGCVAALGEALGVRGWRADTATGERWALVSSLTAPITEAPWPALPAGAVAGELVRPWLLAPIYERVRGGAGGFLAELRPAATLFLSFAGVGCDDDPAAAADLDAVVRFAQATVARHGGAVHQVILGDKGSHLYAAFGAPVSYGDDAARAVAAARELERTPAVLPRVADVSVGLAYGMVRAGAYGGATRRTYGVIGSATNTAARLMQASDGILCDEAIARAAADAWTFAALPPAHIKGRGEALAIFRPASAAARDLPTLDALPAAELLALKVASVAGREFELPLLRHLYREEAGDEPLDPGLESLVVRGLIYPVEGPKGPRLALDAAARVATYERMLFAQRRRLHRAVAEWHEARPDDGTAGRAALLAYHWGQAEDAARALHYLEQAAEAARRNGAHAEALAYLRAALAGDGPGEPG